MAEHGGKRPGAGRKAGSKNRLRPEIADIVAAKTIKTCEQGQSPLEFLLEVQRREDVGMDLRLEAAKAAAPYVHRKQPQAVEMENRVQFDGVEFFVVGGTAKGA